MGNIPEEIFRQNTPAVFLALSRSQVICSIVSKELSSTKDFGLTHIFLCDSKRVSERFPLTPAEIQLKILLSSAFGGKRDEREIDPY